MNQITIMPIKFFYYSSTLVRGNESKQKASDSQEAGWVKFGACQAKHMLARYLQPFVGNIFAITPISSSIIKFISIISNISMKKRAYMITTR